ncbi:MAG: uridine kinase [Bacteriovoracaceae bacterium]|nr:uridine kinase [Bacteriovoracaceae bacterium]
MRMLSFFTNLLSFGHKKVGFVIIIGIAGGSGSGKTTFAKKVLDKVTKGKCNILHMDSYYLPTPSANLKSPKGHPNFDHPKAFDWNLLREHLNDLKSGLSIEVPIYNFTEHRRTHQTHMIEASDIIIFEGIFSLYDEEIRKILDIKCFLHVEADIRFTRRLHRDVKERGRSLESVIEQYYDTVRPMYQRYLSPQKDYADFIVGEETDVAADILSARINEMLTDRQTHINMSETETSHITL